MLARIERMGKEMKIVLTMSPAEIDEALKTWLARRGYQTTDKLRFMVFSGTKAQGISIDEKEYLMVETEVIKTINPEIQPNKTIDEKTLRCPK
jgi:hypothetical protein